MRKEGLEGEQEGTPAGLLEPPTPGPLSGHETSGPQWECGMAAGRRGLREPEADWSSSDSAKDLQSHLYFYESNCDSETFHSKAFLTSRTKTADQREAEVWILELEVSWNLASLSLLVEPQKRKRKYLGMLPVCPPSILPVPSLRWRNRDSVGKELSRSHRMTEW